jgi:hypothetical protein
MEAPLLASSLSSSSPITHTINATSQLKSALLTSDAKVFVDVLEVVDLGNLHKRAVVKGKVVLQVKTPVSKKTARLVLHPIIYIKKMLLRIKQGVRTTKLHGK